MQINKEKIIWIYWHQGWGNAPEIIKICKKSWIKKNPQWDVISLDFETINHFVDINLEKKIFKSLCIAHQSDIIRLNLLEKYGGVWVDASLFCILPLDSWLGNCLNSGLFMFESNTKLTIIANWFIASKKNNILIKKMNIEIIKYWEENIFIKNRILKKIIFRLVKPILNYNKFTARYWLNPFVINLIKIYPYQIFYFIFEKSISQDTSLREIWNNTPKINKYICWPDQLINQKPTKFFKKRLKKEFIPLLKLDWRLNKDQSLKNSTLIKYLVKKHL